MSVQKPFQHNLTSTQVEEISGYLKCLLNLYNYIKDETELNPEKGYIDSVPLLGTIQATSAELSQLFKTAQSDLNNIMNRINVNIKADATDN